MGRHREFDPDAVLDAVVAVFWNKGYEGTSFSDLTGATGVAKPGLFAAFGNKESLFMKALNRYESRYLSFMPAALSELSARKVVEAILRGCAHAHTVEPECKGCLGVTGAIAGSDDAQAVRLELVKRRGIFQKALAKRFEQAKVEGDLPADVSAEALSRMVVVITQGMAIQAKAGATRAQLDNMVDAVLSLWPSPQPL